MKKFNRRNLLKGMGGSAGLLSVTTIDMFTSAFLQGLVRNVQAQEAGITSKSLVNISMFGGPPRWMWDLPLQPNGPTDPLVENIMIKNSFKRDMGVTTSDMKLFKHGEFYTNQFWAGKVPSSAGGLRDCKELLDNMLTIRGIATLTDGHEPNYKLSNRPSPTKSSLSGVASFNSDRVLPTLSNIPQVNDISHKSPDGAGVLRFTSSPKALESLFSSFESMQAVTDYSNSVLHTKIDAFIDYLTTRKSSKVNDNLKLLLKDKKSATDLFNQSFGDLVSVYSTIYDKYADLCKRSLNEVSLPFLDDLPVETEPTYRYTINGKIPIDTTLNAGINASTGFTTLPHSFAVTEFCLLNDISNSYLLSTGTIGGLKFDKHRTAPTGSDKGSFTVGLAQDSHNVGNYPTLFFFPFYFKALTSCILELKDQLVANGKWDDTLIYVSSEFGRTPRLDEKGSEHGWKGFNTSLISGIVPEYQVVGNTAPRDPTLNIEGGDWGCAGPNASLSGRLINMGNVSSTICTMLGVPLLLNNDQSLVTIDNGKTKPSIGKPVNTTDEV